MILKTLNISRNWTLYLDRDGVINHRLVDNYVRTPDEFRFFDGVPEAIRIFSEIFDRIIIVTNQQGIGKGLMTVEELNEVHKKMMNDIRAAGGRIDKIYHCAGLKEQRPFCRKPQVGMGLESKKDFPEINFKKSIIAGDSKSDMQFGRRLKMKTILIGEENTIALESPVLIDYWFQSLYHFAKNLIS
ncbi:MAG: HAD-IIIA family hydrolase [Bacteroidales bacterium]|nr:HAD-IIIA family hydrolase [Bacteroidales bacterium]